MSNIGELPSQQYPTHGGDKGNRGRHGPDERGHHTRFSFREERFEVQMNLFSLQFSASPTKPKLWYQYEASITPLEDKH